MSEQAEKDVRRVSVPSGDVDDMIFGSDDGFVSDR